MNWPAAFSAFLRRIFVRACFRFYVFWRASVDGIVAFNPHFGNGADEPMIFAFSMTESTMGTRVFFARSAVYE
ncbi:hypothetical protein ACWGTI_14645 [Mesorhizobium sp. ArgA1]